MLACANPRADETDWKVLVADVRDPNTAALRDVSDMDPAQVGALREWFRLYKTADGKGPNNFGLGGEAMGAAYALKVCKETHELWKGMATKGCDFNGAACWLNPADHEAEL